MLIFSTMVRALDVVEEHLEECGVAQANPLTVTQLTVRVQPECAWRVTGLSAIALLRGQRPCTAQLAKLLPGLQASGGTPAMPQLYSVLMPLACPCNMLG